MTNNVVTLKKVDNTNPYEDLKLTYQSEIEKVDSFIKDK